MKHSYFYLVLIILLILILPACNQEGRMKVVDTIGDAQDKRAGEKAQDVAETKDKINTKN